MARTKVTDDELASDKLDAIEDEATADQTAAEIKTLYESNANTNAFNDASSTKLASIETGAKVGDVVGPASATDEAIARYDTTTGELLQNSAITVDDSGNLVTPGNFKAGGASGAQYQSDRVNRLVNDGFLSLSGSTAFNKGANILLNGEDRVGHIGRMDFGTPKFDTVTNALRMRISGSVDTATIKLTDCDVSIANRTGDPGTLSGLHFLYTKSGEGYQMDGSGNVTLQTSHQGEWADGTPLESFKHPDDGGMAMPHSLHSLNVFTGKKITVDIAHVARRLAELFPGEKFFEVSDIDAADRQLVSDWEANSVASERESRVGKILEADPNKDRKAEDVTESEIGIINTPVLPDWVSGRLSP